MPGIGDILLLVVLFIVGIGLGVAAAYFFGAFSLKGIDNRRKKAIREAELKAEQILRNAQIDGKQTVYEMKMEADKEIKSRRQEVINLENVLLQREQNLDRRDTTLQSKEQSLDAKHENLSQKLQELGKKEEELQKKIDSIIKELEKVSSMSVSEARSEILARVEAKMEQEVAIYMKNKDEEARDTANNNARDILALAMQKLAQDVTIERTVSVVSLPSDELKGRIIGREGRNIRAIEQLTGVDLIIDDTPEVITVSSFDPIRREIARLSLETLIKDGRIQPGRIEEVVEKVKKDIDEIMTKAGEDAVFRLGIHKINKEIVKTIGRLKYRTSYGQNALQHSMEVAHLCGIMAAELGLNQALARRVGLLHDIGKALDFEQEGSHVELGARLCKKYGEDAVVINGIESHHGDVPIATVYSHLVIAADTLSAARPGARSENLENYIRRVEQLETLSKSFEGVANAYAIQAGREIRVMVQPDKVDDARALKIAREIREKIENEMTYPGQIKVTVIREVRAQDVAK